MPLHVRRSPGFRWVGRHRTDGMYPCSLYRSDIAARTTDGVPVVRGRPGVACTDG